MMAYINSDELVEVTLNHRGCANAILTRMNANARQELFRTDLFLPSAAKKIRRVSDICLALDQSP